jgi:hypothetical protein
MSYGGACEDSGTENPLAVYVRNVPVWFLEENRSVSKMNKIIIDTKP